MLLNTMQVAENFAVNLTLTKIFLKIMQKIIHFETLGCRLNQDETEGAARCFSLAGFKCDLENISSSTQENPNVILSVINTCTVTAKAEQKARRIIRLLLKKFENSPVLVTGCYAELDAQEIKKINPKRICILSGTKKFILSYIAKMMEGKEEISCEVLEKFILEQENQFQKNHENSKNLNFMLYTPIFEKHSRSSIKVQDGCNNNCAFCRIHFARGKSVSLDVEDVVKRVQELERLGRNEVVFTGVNLSQYAGKFLFNDENQNLQNQNIQAEKICDFADLLKIVLENTKNITLRISSLYPQSVNEKFCEVIKNPRVAPSFHLSVQSGSDFILKQMNRPYSVAQVENAVKLLRLAKENPFISCDIIVGFPGETENDFNKTLELCEKLNFAWIHVFPFSARPGTKAFSMENQIPEKIKNERVKILTKLAIKSKVNYIDSFVGKSLNAILENNRSERMILSKQKNSDFVSDFDLPINAVTNNFIHVRCENNKKNLKQGSLVKVKILRSLPFSIQEGRETDAEAEILF